MSDWRARMLLITVAMVLAMAPLALAQGQEAPAERTHCCPCMQDSAGPGMHADAEHGYDPTTVATLTGTVDEVLLRPGRGGATGLHLLLTTDGESLEVLVGPTFFVFPQGLEIEKGDRVTVTGSRFTVDGAPMLMAREITEGDLTLQLRDEAGMPMWQGQGPRSESVEAEGPGQGCACCRGRMSQGGAGGMCKRHAGTGGRGMRG